MILRSAHEDTSTTTTTHTHMSKNTKNGTQGPPPTRVTSTQRPIDPADKEATVGLQQVMGLLEPLLDFQKSVEGATGDDIRMHWDVRIIRGADTAFAHVAGTCTMATMLAPNMQALAPSAIQM